MEKTDLNYIRDFIIMGKPREALEEILNILKRSSKLQVRLRDDAILIRAQFAELERKENLNLIPPDEANRERAQLQKAMLDVINSMEEPSEKPVLIDSIPKPSRKIPVWAIPVALAVVLTVIGIIFGGKIIHPKRDSTPIVQESEISGKEVDRSPEVPEQQPQYTPHTGETEISRADQTPQETGTSQGRTTAKPANLTLANWVFDPDPPVQKEPTRVTFVVKNTGETDAQGFKVEWWAGVNFPQPEKIWTLSLSAGEQQRLSYMYQGYTSWYGRLETKVVIDTENAVQDADRSDNELVRTISVKKKVDEPPPAKPDLHFTSLRFVPEIPVQGQRTQVEATIENRGNAPAANIEVEWWAGANYPGPEKNWTGITLQAGEKKNLIFMYNGYPSWYGRIETKLVADPRRWIDDSDRSNNELIRTISVRKPNG